MNQESEDLSQQNLSAKEIKNKIVLEAKSWIGTKFKHQASFKKGPYDKGACDCLGLLIGITSNLNLKTKIGLSLRDISPKNYPKIPDGFRLKAELDNNFFKINFENIEPGDLILFNIQSNPRHLAIVTGFEKEIFYITHSYILLRKVVEHRLDEVWLQKIETCYSLI